MIRSVRTRLFIGVTCLIVFFVTISWTLNSRYLKVYYIFEKKKTLAQSSKLVDKIYEGEPYLIALELEKLERNAGINIMILDENQDVKYDSSVRIFEKLEPRKRIDYRIHMDLSEMQRQQNPKSMFKITKDPRIKTDFLYYIYLLKNGDYLVLSTPLAAMQESAQIANHFFFYSGILTFIVGSIAAFIFAKKFTKPILELNDIALRMTKLDFSKKYPIQTKDEVAELGKSINSLSDQLDKSITELTQANEKLQRDIEHERKVDEMRKEFISSVSHELKTPIALIQGYAEGLKVNVNEDEENKNFYCDVIIDEASKMNNLVRNLLDLSQIESGYFHLEKRVFDLSQLIENVAYKYQPIFKEKHICVSVENEDNIMVNADSIRTEQVLVNYLNNAIAHVDDKKIIRIAAKADSKKVRVTVFNSGKHIPKDCQDKIWKSFYKVDKARTRMYGGTGLGLSIVRAIQELHESEYGVVNTEQGIEFWFELDRVEIP